jgi:hypothetical protein
VLKAPNRDVLQKIFGDHETIKKIEQLFTVAQISSEDIESLYALAEELDISSSLASANANKSASILQDLINIIASQNKAKQQSNPDIYIPPERPKKRTRYGVFHDTTTQTAAAVNTAYAFTFNATDYSKGVYIGSPTSRVYVDEIGLYNFQFSCQLDKASASAANIWIWARVNGTDIADSASQIRIKDNNAELVAAWNFVLKMNAGDYFELMFEVDDTSIEVPTFTATAVHPVTPSIILTVTNNIGD